MPSDENAMSSTVCWPLSVEELSVSLGIGFCSLKPVVVGVSIFASDGLLSNDLDVLVLVTTVLIPFVLPIIPLLNWWPRIPLLEAAD